MFIQGRRPLGILRKAKPLPAVPGWSRWQRGREISCSCLVLVQECGGGCAALRSYLRGSGTRERCAWQEVPKDTQNVPTPCRVAQDECVPILTHSCTSWPCCAGLYPLWPRAFSQGSSLLHRAWCGACVAAGSRASSPDVNFGTPTSCCLARVLFTHWKPWIYCHCKQPHSGSQRHGAHAAFLPVAWETLPHPYLPSTPFSKGPIYFLACPSAFSRAAWLSKCYYNNTQCPLHSTVSIQGHWKVLSFCSSEVETFMILVSLGCK